MIISTVRCTQCGHQADPDDDPELLEDDVPVCRDCREYNSEVQRSEDRHNDPRR